MKTGPEYRVLLEKTLEHALNHINSLDGMKVSSSLSLEELRGRFNTPLPEEGKDSNLIIDELVNDAQGGLLGNAGGRFYGWVIGGSMPASLAADWLTSAWDQNAAIYACAPAAGVIEEVCGKWLKEILELPEKASFALTTGCQMSHVTCLAAARNAVFAKLGWDVEKKGLAGAPQIKIFSGDQKHGTVERALRLLGFGTDAIIDLPVDDKGCLRAESLAKALKENNGRPSIVLLQAGDLNIGAFDPFEELIPIAHKYNAWVHVDGAFGLWAVTSPPHKHLLKGAELADSWATDGHKWLNVPYDCGYAFVADPQAHRNSMSHRASYLYHEGDARDQIDWNPEWSRRGRSFATYAAIKQLGKKGISDLVSRTCGYAHDIVTKTGALKNAEIIWEPQINQGLIRFNSPKQNATENDNDEFTDKVITEILKEGEAFFGGTTWRGKRCMRVSVCNWQTTDEDVERTVAAVERAIGRAIRES